MRPLRDARNIDDAHERVAGRFNQHQRRVEAQRRVETLCVVLIDESDIELASVAAGGNQAIGSAVTIMRRDNQIVAT